MEAYYENEGQEEARLQPGSVQHIEYLTAMEYLGRYLPKCGRVLDSCAGTGIYSFALAGLGHDVTAMDVVPYNVDIINNKRVGRPALREVCAGDAAELSRFSQASFDAVLCMGALYHSPQASARRAAVRESLRVLRPGGVFAASWMNRYAVIMNNTQPDLANIEDMLSFAQSGEEGIFYASTVGETEELMKDFGLEKLCHVCLDGTTYFMLHTSGLVRQQAFENWCRYHFAVCADESLLGSSYHNLFIGRKA